MRPVAPWRFRGAIPALIRLQPLASRSVQGWIFRVASPVTCASLRVFIVTTVVCTSVSLSRSSPFCLARAASSARIAFSGVRKRFHALLKDGELPVRIVI